MLNQGRKGALTSRPPRQAPDMEYSRPSQGSDIGHSYKSSQSSSNGYGLPIQGGRPPPLNGYGPGPSSNSGKPRLQQPDGATVLNGYMTDIMNGFEEPVRYNPRNSTRPQSSQLLNVNDPIQVHLLVETALSDSKEYELLAPEEVDDLKKQIKVLSQRIQQTRQNLAIQSKYRDAAISMTKLYSPPGRKGPEQGKRRSLLGHKKDNSENADMERIASERKCEELATELFNLEKRLMDPQKRLLKHTAGILQMTHKGPKKTTTTKPLPSQPGGMPSSPDSMYAYHKRNSSGEHVGEDNFLDERSFYRPAGQLDPYSGIRDVDGPSHGPSNAQSKEHMQTISKTEHRLEELNKKLRHLIVKSNPQEEGRFHQPPTKKKGHGKSAAGGATLESHLEYLEKGLAKIDEEAGHTAKHRLDSEAAMEETLKELNHEIRNVLLPYEPNRSEPPKLSGSGLEQQLVYFQDAINAVEMELSRAANVSSRNFGNQESIDQMETILIGLWDMIQAGQQEVMNRKQQRLQKELATGVKEEGESDDEDGDPNEPFSLQAFSMKFRWLYSQATQLKEQKKVLQRQIKHQRELNNKSDATKEAELEQKTQEYENIKQELTMTRANLEGFEQKTRNMEDLQQELNMSHTQYEELKQLHEHSNKNRENDELTHQALEDELAQRNRLLAAVERELQSLKEERNKNSAQAQDRVAAAETKIADLTIELAVAEEAQSRLGATEAKVAELQAKISELQVKISQLQAELDNVDTAKQGNIAEAESRISELEAQLADAAQAQQSLIREKEAALNDKDQVRKERSIAMAEKDAALISKEDEIESMNIKIATLTTEVTLARAELDGAYGTRAQRAAEAATNPAIQKELDVLSNKNAELIAQLAGLQNKGNGGEAQITELKKELKETIEEYEIMTKASIEWEREREQLEGMVDRLRDEREVLEEKLGEEKVRWLGVRSPGVGGPGNDGGDKSPGGSNTSTTVLKNEFKKMMRDMRAESLRSLRAEQAERRKIEDELRALKRSMGPGKSGLSQSVGS